MIRRLLLATTLYACLALQVHAQSTFGDLRGTTRDPSGLALPAAAVVLHSLDENNDHQAISSDDGSFLIENLKPGRYQLTASEEGFQKSPTVNIELSARQSLRVDLTLRLATSTARRKWREPGTHLRVDVIEISVDAGFRPDH